jgi:hypothetical protein
LKKFILLLIFFASFFTQCFFIDNTVLEEKMPQKINSLDFQIHQKNKFREIADDKSNVNNALLEDLIDQFGQENCSNKRDLLWEKIQKLSGLVEEPRREFEHNKNQDFHCEKDSQIPELSCNVALLKNIFPSWSKTIFCETIMFLSEELELDETQKESYSQKIELLNKIVQWYDIIMVKLILCADKYVSLDEHLYHEVCSHVLLEIIREIEEKYWKYIRFRRLSLEELDHKYITNNFITNKLKEFLSSNKIFFLKYLEKMCFKRNEFLCFDIKNKIEYEIVCRYSRLFYKIYEYKIHDKKIINQEIKFLQVAIQNLREILLSNLIPKCMERRFELDVSDKILYKIYVLLSEKLDVMCRKFYQNQCQISFSDEVVPPIDPVKKVVLQYMIFYEDSKRQHDIIKNKKVSHPYTQFMNLCKSFLKDSLTEKQQVDIGVLILTLKQLKTEYQVGPIRSWWNGENIISLYIEDMINVLGDIEKEVSTPLALSKSDEDNQSLIQKIFSGEWLPTFSSKNSLVENFKKSWTNKEFDVAKKIAIYLLGYSSPVLTTMFLKYLLPYFSSKIKPIVMNFLQGSDLEKNSFTIKGDAICTPKIKENILSFLNNNEHVLEDLIDKNPLLLNKLVNVVRQKLQPQIEWTQK